MLKALEVVGFKSFADKTRFEFPKGVTVVVGPNGSGKSNVVDAIKWVLGEQSVKSLRGKEMADVIFNGSAARRPVNSAEATLTFDNSNRLLPVDAAEVHITRRIYRSGEGEYLINRQPCRLRDIRDALAGTGLGTQAYSVIEQGKVDLLLQSSSKDRRVIFEEAAGISRFKARKIEALRRLERVEQNLLRLKDIVDEVESRLRSVRLQAGKARRYKEFSDRLQELRTQVALVDWRRLSEQIDGGASELAQLSAERDTATTQVESHDARLLELEHQMGVLVETARRREAQAAENRASIAAAESTIEHERARGRDLEQEIDRYRRQIVAMNARAGGLDQQLRDTAEAVGLAEAQQRDVARRLGEGEQALTDLIEQLDRLGQESRQRRTQNVETMRTTAALGKQISALESQLTAALGTKERLDARLVELDRQIAAIVDELAELDRRRQELAAEVAARTARLEDAQAALAERRRERERKNDELIELRQRHSAVLGRVSVLEELEKRYEGLSPGVRDVMTAARGPNPGPFRQVCGLVADLFKVSVEAAPLVEVALGEAAQCVVVRPGQELIELLQRQPYQFNGRVTLFWHDPARCPSAASLEPGLDGKPGVLGRADRFVECDREFEPLARRLLGGTWFVERLSHAVALAAAGAPGNFVTLAGERLTADGTLAVGPRHTSTGLISRRSELRVLRQQLADLETRIQHAQAALARLDEQIGKDQREVEIRTAEQAEGLEQLGLHGHKITAAEERRVQTGRQQEQLRAELQAAVAEHDGAKANLAQAQHTLRAAEAALAEMDATLGALAQQIDRLESRRQAQGLEANESKVDLAKSEERLGNLRGQMRRLEESQEERQRAIAEGRDGLAQCLRRAQESCLAILRAEAETAEQYLLKESFHAEIADINRRREALQTQRAGLAAEAQRLRSRIRKLDEKIHARGLLLNEVRLERTALADRFREDYGIELTDQDREPTEEEQHRRDEVQREIDALRQKINHLGNVNLEALEEIEQLETRHATLAGQFKDLSDAKSSLARIIEKINVDSRKLFIDTLETVRGHFVQLFRDLFGGGQADILLEEGVDILEGGVEIVARPPGKELRSISLMSGGEKTLTCVALLLALFRSRPSPFCVLDEVDAALDEANIDRFTKVLHDFLAWTQFIIISHSKKTMTCATTMYGVTMQDSGVSKPVAVRFEDVSDNGEILIKEPPKEEAA